MDWVTGRPAFRWQSALGLIGIAAGPQILWWQNGSPTLLTWLSPIPATAAFAWWILRRRAYLRLAKKSLSGPMISTVVGLGTSTTRWTVDSQGERKAQTSLQVAGETFPIPKGGEGVAIDGPVRIQVLSLVSLDHPHSPPTRWLVAVELLDPT